MTQQNFLKTFKQEQKKNELLLYGHLYVIALLICAFLLMEKKIKKLMQETFVFTLWLFIFQIFEFIS